jgi:hypothetical protein
VRSARRAPKEEVPAVGARPGSADKLAALGLDRHLRMAEQPNIIERIKRELQDTQPGPGIEEIRRRLAKIPGSVAAEIIAERGER